jgi:hypothetical protein
MEETDVMHRLSWYGVKHIRHMFNMRAFYASTQMATLIN